MRTKRRRIHDAAVQTDFSPIDTRFSEFAGQVDKWSEEIVRTLRLQLQLGGQEFSDEELRVIRALTELFGKWSIEILSYLVKKERLGFEELRRSLRGVSSRVLSTKLKEMENAGLVNRTVVERRPPRVMYTLTERGALLASLGRPAILFLLKEKYGANSTGNKVESVTTR